MTLLRGHRLSASDAALEGLVELAVLHDGQQRIAVLQQAEVVQWVTVHQQDVCQVTWCYLAYFRRGSKSAISR